MVKTAVQLYTLRDFDVSDPKKIQIAAETDVDGVEIEFNGPPSEATLEALEETGLEVAGLTTGLDVLREKMTEVVEACEILDTKTVILGHLNETYFESTDATRQTATLLSTLAEQYQNHGLRFLYHTHRHEFATDEQTAFDLLFDNTDDAVEFELDCGWIGVTGKDPNTVIEKVGNRTASVHLKDMDFDDEEFTNLGEGDLDVERAARTAVETDVDWLVYEHENPADPVESVVTGASKLRQFKQMD
ncbi:sugar phosphate isomerase/epimerase family protein [Halorussus salinisoli]|uniref:sugar phosphate isomerase/epimerase family protein n=1 Tax=Halorussus salinisoli TaxID=2558242 RepID=UPI0010C22BAB|nr:sugar phosphate isomerase/epimerase [Halorussus salinisoli]